MNDLLPVLVPFALSILAGLAISIPLIKFARTHEWFEDGHIITRKQFELELEHAFKGREPLSPEQYYEAYFAKQGIPKEIPIRVRCIFEEHFEADFSRMKDDDDFSKELRFFWDYDSMNDVEIVIALEKAFDIKISDAEAAQMKTIHAIVDTIWNKKRNA